MTEPESGIEKQHIRSRKRLPWLIAALIVIAGLVTLGLLRETEPPVEDGVAVGQPLQNETGADQTGADTRRAAQSQEDAGPVEPGGQRPGQTREQPPAAPKSVQSAAVDIPSSQAPSEDRATELPPHAGAQSGTQNGARTGAQSGTPSPDPAASDESARVQSADAASAAGRQRRATETAAAGTASFPWTAPLAAAPSPFRDRVFDVPAEAFAEEQLKPWLAAVEGETHRLYSTQHNGLQYACLQGVSRLKPDWVPQAVLRMGLFRTQHFRIHVWFADGRTGVTFWFAERPHPHRWAAYRTTRQPGNWQPETWTLIGSDEGRHMRLNEACLELRHEQGLLRLTCGHVPLLEVPASGGAPDEIVFEGDARFSTLQMYRSEPLPETKPPEMPLRVRVARPERHGWLTERKSLADPERVLPERESGIVELAAADGDWQTQALRDGARLTAVEGAVELSAEKTGDWLWSGMLLPEMDGLCLLEFHVLHADAGTGVYLGDVHGRPGQALAFRRDSRSQRVVFEPARASDARWDTNQDPSGEPPTFFGDDLWFRVLVSVGGVKFWISPDGHTWSRAVQNYERYDRTPIGSFGLYAMRGESSRRIRLGEFRIRKLAALNQLVSNVGEVLEVADDAEAARSDRQTDMATWLAQTLANRPEGMSERDWLTASALRALRSLSSPDVLQTLLEGLVREVERRSDMLDHPRDILDELAMLSDLVDDTRARQFRRLYQTVVPGGESESLTTGLDELILADVTAPVWSGQTRAVADEQFVRHVVLYGVYLADDRELAAITRQLRWCVCSADPDRGWDRLPNELRRPIEWAESFDGETGEGIAGRLQRRQSGQVRHPLIAEISKEGFNIVTEFESAIASRSFADACRIVASTEHAGLLGLLPDTRDPQLLVSLSRAIALRMDSIPELQETMRQEWGPRGLIRVRQAIQQKDRGVLQIATVQFYGTRAAVEAHLWLADQDISQGLFDDAERHLEAALASDPQELAAEIQARLQLLDVLRGRRLETATDGADWSTARFGDVRVSPDDLAELQRERALRRPDESGGVPVAAPLSPIAALQQASVPEPREFTVRSRALLDGSLGTGAGSYTFHRVDWPARQLAVGADAETLYVSNRFQVTAFLRANGERRWSTQLGGNQGQAHDWPYETARPLVVSGGPDQDVYVRRFTKRGPELARLARDTGEVRWNVQPDNHVTSDPFVLGGRLAAFTVRSPESGFLELCFATFDAATGNLLAVRPVLRFHDIWRLKPICRTQALKDRVIVTMGGSVACCDVNGGIIWLRKQLWIDPQLDRDWMMLDANRPLVHGDRVFLLPQNVREVCCVNLQTGRRIWSRPLTAGRRLIAATTHGLVLQTDRGIMLLDAEDGRTLWERAIEDPLHACLADDTCVVFAERIRQAPNRIVPSLGWLETRSGRTLGQTLLESLNGKEVFLGPLLSAGERLWAFHGRTTWKDPKRELLELIPATGPAPGPTSDPLLDPWLTHVDPQSRIAVASVLPGWTLLQTQQHTGRNKSAERLEDHQGASLVLLTRARREQPVRLARQLKVPDVQNPRLVVRVAHADGTSWRLVIHIAGQEALSQTIDANSTTDGWAELNVPLTDFRGKTPWVIVTQESLDRRPVVEGYWDHVEFVW